MGLKVCKLEINYPYSEISDLCGYQNYAYRYAMDRLDSKTSLCFKITRCHLATNIDLFLSPLSLSDNLARTSLVASMFEPFSHPVLSTALKTSPLIRYRLSTYLVSIVL